MTEGQEETPFNMAMLYYVELTKLRNRFDEYFDQRNYTGCYRQLRLITAKISYKFNKEEKAKIIKSLNDIRNEMNVSIGGKVADQIMGFRMPTITDNLMNIYNELNDLMFKYNMIFPKIQTTGLKDLLKRYDLK